MTYKNIKYIYIYNFIYIYIYICATTTNNKHLINFYEMLSRPQTTH